MKWNRHFTSVVENLGLIPCPNDPCLFKYEKSNDIAYLLLYVDDMLIASNSMRKLNEIKIRLSKEFEMTDLGTPKTFLGLEIKRDRNNKILEITQKQFMNKILEKFNMNDCKQHLTPMMTKGNMTKNYPNERPITQAPYREAIGTLLYLSGGTRPDMSYAVNTMSRRQIEPTEEDWMLVKRIFRYIRGSNELGLRYTGNTETLELYTDASFIDNSDSTSTGGYIIKLFGDTIAWRSKEQKLISLSVSEAEYLSMSEGCRELISLHKIIQFLLSKTFTPMTIWCDNKAAVNCVSLSYPVMLRHCLHKNINYVKECEKNGLIKVSWISSKEQLADIMTKALPIQPFVDLRNQILNNK